MPPTIPIELGSCQILPCSCIQGARVLEAVEFPQGKSCKCRATQRSADAGTRLAVQLILTKGFKILFTPITRHGCPVLLFLVTTSLCQDWVICAPAAFLGCGSRFSLEREFGVTCQQPVVFAQVRHLKLEVVCAFSGNWMWSVRCFW